MDKITVGFSRPKTFKLFAWVIMKTYNIPYDHVYVKFHSESYDRDIIYQASNLMVNFMSPVVFESANVIVDEFEIDILEENKLKMIQFAIDNAGKPYGFMEAVGLGLVRLCELFGKKIKNPFGGGTQNYVCSVIAGYILEQYAGAQIPGDFENVSPPIMYNYLMSLKKPSVGLSG